MTRDDARLLICPYCRQRGQDHCPHPQCSWRYCPRCKHIFTPTGTDTFGRQHPPLPPTHR